MSSTTLLSLFPSEIVDSWLKKKPHKYKKGELILSPDDQTVYILLKGKVQIFYLHPEGKECVISIMNPGECIGLLEVFSKRPQKRFARALTESEGIAIPISEVYRVVTENPSLALHLLHDVTEQLEETLEILEQVAYGKVEERLLFLLNKIADQQVDGEGYAQLPTYLTHRDLAGMIASTRETVTYLINKLIQEGIIKQRENTLWLHKSIM